MANFKTDFRFSAVFIWYKIRRVKLAKTLITKYRSEIEFDTFRQIVLVERLALCLYCILQIVQVIKEFYFSISCYRLKLKFCMSRILPSLSPYSFLDGLF